MNFTEAISMAGAEAESLITNSNPRLRKDALQNESLFHTPLIALTIMLLSKGKSKPRADEIGMFVGRCFEQSLPTFKGSSQELGWSANLRIRTVKALTFLEMADFVKVNKNTYRLETTPDGRKLIDKLIAENSKLCLFLLTAQRAYRNICKETAEEEKLHEI
ncbi:hypothetical protein [Pseudomonas denitrificans (nom. rej.)]|uniref:Uncharacterized protein n=1 Tax=Pseudomonas denitrificans TaxID=43306 RepID=A0A9X7R741_PSEDE|nr:hypothetical protein [Pseudomonas denitrificans (nom. rej.)]QEY75037.1 hypothetical protein F1C79_27335 [Pseudomonas denitrificans (nom. rej.)]